MKTNSKLTILFITLIGFIIFFSLGYFYIRYKEQKLYQDSAKQSANQVIRTVLSFKSEGLLKPIRDNAAWDEMVAFLQTHDTSWSDNILRSILETHGLNCLMITDLNGNMLTKIQSGFSYDALISPTILTRLFADTTTISFFLVQEGNLIEISGATIVPTDDINRTTPPKGFLVSGLIWDSLYLQGISESTGFSVHLLQGGGSFNDASEEESENLLRIPLQGWQGTTVGVLEFTRQTPDMARIDNFGYLTAIAFFLLLAASFMFIYLTNRWISRPLKAIESSLASNDTDQVIPMTYDPDEFGNIARLVISSRQQKEDLIKKNDEVERALMEIRKLSSAIDQSANAVMITDKNGNIEYVNKHFSFVTGYTKEEVIGRNPKFLKSGMQNQEFYRGMWKTILAGQEWKGELANRKKEGTIYWESTSIAPIKDKDGAIVNFIAIKEDITERIRTEQQLKESRAFADLVYKVVPSAIFTVDSEQRVTSWNRQAEKITGFPAEEMIGQRCFAFAEAPCRERCGLFDKTIVKPLHGKECTIRTKDGRLLTVAKNVDQLTDNHGRVFGGIESFEDITERKMTEVALIKAKEAAEIANKAKSEFLATMSHEIRTPMNGVIGMTELALTTNLTSSQRDYLQSIQTSAYLLLDTINDILDFSKIEAGRLEIEHVEFDLAEVVERSVEILTVKAFEKKIELLCEIEPGLPGKFKGDPLRIRQILVNLISNAVKFTAGGEIFVAARCTHRPAHPTEPYQIRFSVKDTGIGIDQEKIAHIFDRFTQADSSTTRKYGGTGLGLSISKRLVDMMSGTIVVSSEPGKGSEFAFTLPLMSVGDEISTPTLPGKTIKNILVVDDNETNLKIMTGMLQYWGIACTVCRSGAEALKILEPNQDRREEFDLIILDLHMPGMDGAEVAERIREKINPANNPIIFLHSSVDREHLSNAGKDINVDRFLTKPVKMRDMYELLTWRNTSAATPLKAENEVFNEVLTLDPSVTIMIAEDNAINMKILSTMLIKTGATVIQTGDGEEAIRQYLNRKIDLIFMDVHMPLKDGFQTTQEIRALETGKKHTPIVALTAIAMPGDRDKCLEVGMDDYLSKPFKKDDLFAVLSHFLKKDNL